LVADKVTVTSKNNEDPKQYIWESNAGTSYTIQEDTDGEPLVRGTKITLHIKDDALEYLSTDKVKELINKFSQFIAFPIKVRVPKTIEEEVPVEDEDKNTEDKETKDDDVEVKDDDEEESPKTKKVKKTVYEWEHINTAKPIWMRPKSNITEDDYNEFYKAISKDYQDPLAYTHFSAEGQTEFRSILFIPKRAPFDVMDNYWKKHNDIKLYVRRVMVADKMDDLMPAYLGFIKGVVDSDDLPLNVNRDQLQQSKVMKVISKKLVKKALDLLKDLSDEHEGKGSDKDGEDNEDGDSGRPKKERKEGEKSDWETFYDNFATQLKLGCYEDDANKNRIAKLLRFNTWKHPKEFVTLEKYLADAGEENKSIYYMSGSSIDVMLKSPALQAFKKKGIDVLLLSENMDEPCINKLSEFDGKKFVSIQKTDVKLPETDEEKDRYKKLKKMYKPLTEWWKSKLDAVTEKDGDLGQADIKIEGVIISKRLVDSPCVVVSSQYGHSAQQERIMKAQAFQRKDEFGMYTSRKTLEINPNHPVVADLLEKVKADKDDPNATETAAVLFQAALLDSGYELSDPSALVGKLYKLMSVQLGVDPEAKAADVEIPDSVEVDDEKEEKNEELNFGGDDFDDFDFDDDATSPSEDNTKDEL
jgi:heat shock protein beta